jgi:hypothetical protein
VAARLTAPQISHAISFMKSRLILFSIGLLFSFILPFSAAHADVPRPFDFKATSECEGCVSFSEYRADFGLLEDGFPVRLRIYYSVSYYSLPSETSEYIELPIQQNYQTGQIEIPAVTFGNFSSGSRYAFAYGLVSENGHLLWFMKDDEFDSDRHMVDVL